jgi:hypothetical protein
MAKKGRKSKVPVEDFTIVGSKTGTMKIEGCKRYHFKDKKGKRHVMIHCV